MELSPSTTPRLARRLMIYTGVTALLLTLLTSAWPLYEEYHYNQIALASGASPTEVEARFRERLAVILIGNGLKVFGVAVVVFVLFQQLVTRPLAQITAYARQLNSDTLDQPLALDRRPGSTLDELDGLVQALNTMGANLAHTQHQAAEQQRQLAEANRLTSLGRMVSGVAHEINNPNNVVLINAQWLEEAWQDVLQLLDEELSNVDHVLVAGLPYAEIQTTIPTTLRDLRRAAEKIQALVQTLKKFYKSPGHQREFVDLNDVVENTVALLRPVIRRHTHYLDLDLTRPLPTVIGQGQQLEQVVVNLLSNALESLSDRDRRIWINTMATDNEVMLSVADEGCGIESVHRESILDPFFTTKQASGGTGLGLSICYNLIQEHGGRLEVDSVVNEGTVVRVILPRSPQDEERHP